MMKNYDQSVEINHNLNWPYIPDYPYRMLVIVSSESGKTNVLLNLIKNQRPDIDKRSIQTKMSMIHSNQSINWLLTEDKK